MGEHQRKLLGQKIREERLKRAWTIEELAEHAGISSSFLSSVERGERSLSIENLMKFSQIFEVTLDYLLQEIASDKSRIEMMYQLVSNFSDAEFEFLIETIRTIKKFLELQKTVKQF